MLNIALELAKHRRIYEDIASKFFEHFILISDAMTYRSGGEDASLWSLEDGFYYDAISWGGPFTQQLPVRSLVGLIPLFAVLTLEPEVCLIEINLPIECHVRTSTHYGSREG